MIPPSSLVISSGMGAYRSSTARVQRGPSEAARCASTEDHQAPSPPLLAPSGKKILLLERGGYLRRVGTVCETRRTRASFTRGPGGLDDGWSSDRLLALFHFDSDGMGGRDKIVVLRGTFHGDLVIPLAQALKLPFKTLLILIIHVHMDMRSLGALGQFVLQLKAVVDLFPVLGRRNHHLRPVLYQWFIWFILCEYWCSGERTS